VTAFGSKLRCPYLETPFEECYVNGMGSAEVEKAIEYCGGDFEECEVYAHHRTGAERALAAEDGG
jgi:hypothetical protein